MCVSLQKWAPTRYASQCPSLWSPHSLNLGWPCDSSLESLYDSQVWVIRRFAASARPLEMLAFWAVSCNPALLLGEAQAGGLGEATCRWKSPAELLPKSQHQLPCMWVSHLRQQTQLSLQKIIAQPTSDSNYLRHPKQELSSWTQVTHKIMSNNNKFLFQTTNA